MSSYLEKQSSAFKGNLASAASKLSTPSGAKAAASSKAAASLAPPSPSPSAASDAAAATPQAKRKRDAEPHVPFSQPQLTGYGAQVGTQMTFAVDWIKTKTKPKTIKEIVDHLNVRAQTEEHKKELTEGLRRHPRITWRPDPKLAEQNWEAGTYEYRPVIPGVRDPTELVGYLQRKTDASATSVKSLEDGWPQCKDFLTNLEQQHRILVVRTKKDNNPKYVWSDDASLHHAVQPEFISMWQRVPLPSLDDMHRKLVAVGQKPTSEDPRKAAMSGAGKPKVQKKRAGKRAGKATNVHMQHLMQDYSGMRR